MIHTIYTMTIGRFAELMETGDINLVKRFNIWLPKKYLLKQYHNLIKSYNELTNEKGVKQKVNDNFDKLSVDYQFMWYEAMQKMIQIWYQLHGEDKKQVRKDINELFKAKYGKEPTEEDFLRIPKEYKLLAEKAQQVFAEPEQNKELDYEADLIAIENLIAPITLRDKKLYTFNKYVELAVKKSKRE